MPEHPAAARQGAHVATSRRCGKKLRCTAVARQRALPAASQCGDESSALVSQEYAPLAATQRDDEPSSFGDVAQQSAPPAAVRSDTETAKHPAAARQGAPVATSRRCSKKLRRVRSQQRSGVIPKCWSTRSAAQQRAFPDDPSSFGDVAQQSAPPAAVRGDSCEMPEHPAAARQGAHVATSRRCGKKLRCTIVARQRALPAASQCGDESSALVSQEYAPLAATQRDDEPSSFGDVAQQSAPPAAVRSDTEEYAPLAATQRDDEPSSFGDVAQSNAPPTAVRSDTEVLGRSAAAQQRAFPYESPALVPQENAPLAATQRDDEPSSFGDAVRQGESSALTSQGNTPLAVTQRDDGRSSFGDVAQSGASPAAVRSDTEMPEHSAAAQQRAFPYESPALVPQENAPLAATQRDDEPSSFGDAVQQGESSALTSQGNTPLAVTQRDDGPSSFGDVAQSGASPATVQSHTEMPEHSAAAQQRAFPDESSAPVLQENAPLASTQRDDEPSSFGDVAQTGALPAAVRSDTEMLEHSARSAAARVSRRSIVVWRCGATERTSSSAASQCGDESSALVSQEYAPLAATQRDDEPSSFGDVAQQSAPPAAVRSDTEEYAPLAATQRDDEPSSFGDVAQSNAPPTAVRSDTEVLGRSAAAQQRAFPYESPALVPQENAPLAATQRDDEPSSFGDAVRQGESSALTSQGNTPLVVTQRDDGPSSFGDVAQSGASPAAVRSNTEMPEHSAAAQQRTFPDESSAPVLQENAPLAATQRDDEPSSFGDVAQSNAPPAAVRSGTEVLGRSAAAQQRAFPYESPALVPQENAPLAATTQRDDEPSSFGDAVRQGESSALTSQGNTPLAVTQRDDGPSSFGDVAQSGASPAAVRSNTEMPEHSAAAQQRAFPDESSAPVLQENAPLASTQRDDEPSSFGDVAQSNAPPAAVRSDTEVLGRSAAAQQCAFPYESPALVPQENAPLAATQRDDGPSSFGDAVRQGESSALTSQGNTPLAVTQRDDGPSSFGDVAQSGASPATVQSHTEMPEHSAAAQQRAFPDESSAPVLQENAPLASTQRDDEPSSFGDVAQTGALPAAEYAPLAATQRDDEPSSFGDVAQSNAPPTAVRSDTEVLGRSAAAQQRAFPYESPALVPQENAPLAATQRDDEPSSFGDAVRQGESSALTSQGNTPLVVTQRDDGPSSFGDVAQSGASPAAIRSNTEMPEHSAAAQQRAFPDESSAPVLQEYAPLAATQRDDEPSSFGDVAQSNAPPAAVRSGTEVLGRSAAAQQRAFPYESPALVPQENAPLAATTQRDDEPSSFGDAVRQGESSALTSQGNTPLAVTQRDDGPSSFGDVAQSGASPAAVRSNTEMPEHSAAAQQRAFPDESSAPVLQENAPLASTQRDDEPSSFGDVAQSNAPPAAVRSDTEVLGRSAAAQQCAFPYESPALVPQENAPLAATQRDDGPSSFGDAVRQGESSALTSQGNTPLAVTQRDDGPSSFGDVAQSGASPATVQSHTEMPEHSAAAQQRAFPDESSAPVLQENAPLASTQRDDEPSSFGDVAQTGALPAAVRSDTEMLEHSARSAAARVSR
ncbi:hypothetical protein CYMTET_38049 [Cymbomonas tetramitiformis]|uniref:Uncharacterized protein n=1 Tax=Cymbomonas tetramitiformis TaxID=36881 RepID=A0AAE0F5L2_9CHLO|nr:hypothetical protein CYMTET_38049 [Cymbomonas tetramitiformis]